MDLIGFRCQHFRLIWVLLATSLLCSVAHSWRISQKCPHGHYYNDGCTACWCDITTGITKCERLLQCAKTNGNANCPRGRQYKDNCGNDCTCYESTGAVFCNEKRRCPPPTVPPSPTAMSSLNNNVFLRRDGLLAVDEPPMIMQSSTPRPFFNTYPSSTPSSLYDKIAISSTPHPQLRIPGRSEELIIEPAIIIRKKGSNKASVVRNPHSATSVTLSSSSRQDAPSIFTPTRGTSTIYLNDNNPQNPRPLAAPLHLYEKQLKMIMDIKRAYAQLLHSKVNVNLRMTPSSPPNNFDFNRVVASSQDNTNPFSIDHPRRFDSEYGNSTVIMNTTPSSNFFTPSQQPAPSIQSTPFWRKPELIRKEIKNVLKQFSPVPPLKQLVNYVTTSTESYLSQFLKLGNRNRQNQEQNTNFPTFESVTNAPQPSTTISNLYGNSNNFGNGNSNSWPYSFPSSSPEPYHHNVNQFAPHNNIPIHQVYQNHNFAKLFTATTSTTTPLPPVPYTTYSNNLEQQMSSNLHYQSYYPNQFEKTNKKPTNSYNPNHPDFPFMSELMHEIARVDNFQSPPPTISTSRSSPALTALPTFSTPGPPYAEVDVVQPLSFLPPPRPEPATPTHRSFTVRPPPSKSRYPPPPRPTVRVNMDKPIYIPNIMLPPQLRPPIRRNFVKPPFYQIRRQYILPKPKQYRLVLKGGLRDAAVRVDDVVPRFVSKIAHEFFKKPEIYVPKIRPGKPLTLEKVVLNHKEMVPKEVVFQRGAPPTKMRFTPNAQWTMREEMAKHGIMLNEPMSPARDYAKNDPNVMEMDAPVHAVQTYETHANMGMGHYSESAPSLFNNVGPPTSINDQLNRLQQQQQQQSSFSNQNIFMNQHQQQNQQQSHSNQNIFINQQQKQQPSFSIQNTHLNQHQQYQQQPSFSNQNIQNAQYNQQQQQTSQLFPQFSILLPSPSTPPQTPVMSIDQQHQQELQHQLNLLAQQHAVNTAASSGSTLGNGFKFDPNEFDDFKREDERDVLPKELQIPGVQQVVVDKVVVHDPMDPSGPIMFSTTTIQPPHNGNSQFFMGTNRRDGNLGTQTILNGGPTPPSVLIRHHGAPSPSPASATPTQPSAFGGNFFVTVISSTTPNPIATSPASAVLQSPSQSQFETNNGGSNLVSQIQEYLANQMDFGANQDQAGLYGMMFQSRSGVPSGDADGTPETETHAEDIFEDQIATETHAEDVFEDQIATKMSSEVEVETDHLANIFSQDYQRTHGKKAPQVIVIKVPLNHSDGPFPKVVEKRGGEEVEITGGSLPTYSKNANETAASEEDDEEIIASTENSIVTSTSKSVSSSESKSREEEGDDDHDQSSRAKRRRKKNKKRKRRKKGRRNRNRSTEDKENSKSDKSKESKKGDTESESSSSKPTDAENKFQAELDWKSQLMSNICDLNPSSPLCLTYRSICLLMTSDD